MEKLQKGRFKASCTYKGPGFEPGVVWVNTSSTKEGAIMQACRLAFRKAQWAKEQLPMPGTEKP